MNLNYDIVGLGNIHLQMDSDGKVAKTIEEKRSVIDAFWEEKKKDHASLFDGELFSYTAHQGEEGDIFVKGCFVGYRDYIAQHEHIHLGIKPIGVSGMILFKDQEKEYTLFAQRASDVLEYPDYLELVPSGGIERACEQDGGIHYKTQLKKELYEETGLSSAVSLDVEEFAFVLDKNHSVYDVGCKINVNISKEELFRKLKVTKEYRAFECVEMKELDQFLTEHKNKIVPTSMALMDAYQQSVCA